MGRADLTASTPATRADAWSTAEHTALASAARLDDDARTARARAGELVGRPDMNTAAQRLSEEATAAEHDAAQRRGLAQGYATIRALQGGAATGTNPGAALATLPSREQEVTCPVCQGSGTSGANHLAPNGLGVCSTCKGEKKISAQRADWEIKQTNQPNCEAENGEKDEDEDTPIEPEVFTHCYECDEPLDAPTTNEEQSVHDDCDTTKPDRFWWGERSADGTKVKRTDCEGFRSVKRLAEEVLDGVLEWEEPYGASFIELENGSVVDARAWIEQSENLELAGGHGQYDGKGEFDPAKPSRCWSGQTLPSGRMARPCARSYDTVEELAAEVCRGVFGPGKNGFDAPHTLMLPGGELVDADEWAHRPETRRLAGYLPVRTDPAAPQRCWIGPTPKDEAEPAPMEKLATSYDDVAALAAEVCRKVFEVQRGHDRLTTSSTPLTVVLPGGELVDAFEWAQQAETQHLAGYAPIEFDPTAPQRCWLGRGSAGAAPVQQLATRYDDVAALAADLCTAIFRDDRIHSRTGHVVMLPGGELVDAYAWAQQPATRRLAGCTQVRNHIRFEATAYCKPCDRTTTCEGERTVQGEIGEQRMADGLLHCDGCDDYLSITPVPVTLIDDASGAAGQPPRQI